MNDNTIQMIAQAIIANTKVIQSLIDALPHDVMTTVAGVVNPTPTMVSVPAPSPAPVAVVVQTPSPLVVTPTVAPASVTLPTPAPSPSVAAAMPPPPTFAAPAAAPKALPFSDIKELITYVMSVYKELGPQKGAGIQDVMTKMGYANINDVRPEHYAKFHAAIEALKA